MNHVRKQSRATPPVIEQRFAITSKNGYQDTGLKGGVTISFIVILLVLVPSGWHIPPSQRCFLLYHINNSTQSAQLSIYLTPSSSLVLESSFVSCCFSRTTSSLINSSSFRCSQMLFFFALPTDCRTLYVNKKTP